MQNSDNVELQVLPIILLQFSIIFIISNIIVFLRVGTLTDIPLSSYLQFALNSLTAIVFVYLIFYPQKFVIYTILFSIHGMFHIYYGKSIIGCLFFVLAGAFILRSHSPDSFSLRKTLPLLPPLLVSLFSQIRNGPMVFLNAMFDILYCAMFFTLLFFLLRPYYAVFKKTPSNKKILDLTKLALKPRDIDFIKRVLNNEKYESIAAQHGVSVSSVKQRLSSIYRKLGVSCRVNFLVKYSNALIIDGEGSAS